MTTTFRRLILCAVTSVIWAVAVCGAPVFKSSAIPDEDLTYNVMYKWGLINKKAGEAHLQLRTIPGSGNYKAVLTASSEPWADKIYTLRDTLTTEMARATLAPVRYERAAHENGRYEHDVVTFTRINDTFTAECIHTRLRKNEREPSTLVTELEAEGMTVDFVSAFYYLRALDFTSMLPGHAVTINIFSGKRKELLKFTFCGLESVKVGKTRQNAYKVEFTFSSDGKKKTSDPITAWISTDGTRTPLLIEGKLPIGKVRCELQ